MNIFQTENLARAAAAPAVGAGYVLRGLPLAGLGETQAGEAESWGSGFKDAFQDYYDEQVDRIGDDVVKSGGAKIVYDVQVRMVERGAALSKYGVDGKWGAESQAAWDSVVGGPVTRDAVSNLVGYDYTGSMSVFGVSEGGGGAVVPQPPAPEPSPPSGSEDWVTYALIGLGALAVGGVVYYVAKGRKGRR